MGSYYNAPWLFNALADWLAKGGTRPLVAIILFWVFFWPGWMFWITILVEHRPVHLRTGQSKTFMPGDCTLGCMFVWLLILSSRLGIRYTGTYMLATAVVAVIFAMVARWLDIKLEGYQDPRATAAPSKLAHDYLGFGVCGWLIISPAIKVVWYTFACPRTFQENVDVWAKLIIACLIFGSLIIYDTFIRRPDPNIMHPANWAEKQERHPWRAQWREICDTVNAIAQIRK